MNAAKARRSGERHGMLMIVAAASLWGTSGIVGQYLYGVSDISPITVGFYRLAVASCLVLVAGTFLMPRKLLSLPRDTWVRVAVVGAGLGVFQACYFASVQVVGVGVATLVTLGLAPVFVTAGSTIFFGEKAGGRVLGALAVALFGLTLLVWDPSDGEMRTGILLGIAFAAGSALGYTGVTLVSRSLAARVDPFRLTLFGFAVGAVVLLLPAAYAGLAVEMSHTSVAPLLYLGMFPTVAAYGLFFTGLRTVRPSVASILTFMEPLTATLLARLIFGERLGTAGILGGALLLSAVVVLYAGRDRG
jgi:drug/metabolite transporter, DME family